MPIPHLGLRPLQSGYSAQASREAAVDLQALPGGRSRVRAGHIGTSSNVSVKWALTRDRYSQLMAFMRTTLVSQSGEFTIDLVLDSSTPLRYTARLVPGSLRLDGWQGNKAQVSADLEVEQMAFTSDEDNAIMEIYEEYPDGSAGDILALLADLVNNQLPA